MLDASSPLNHAASLQTCGIIIMKGKLPSKTFMLGIQVRGARRVLKYGVFYIKCTLPKTLDRHRLLKRQGEWLDQPSRALHLQAVEG